MGDQDVAVAERLAIDPFVFHQGLENGKALQRIRMYFLCRFLPPALYPLTAAQPPPRQMRLSAVSAGASPTWGIGFEYGGFDAMFPGEKHRRRQSGKARADNGDVNVDAS